MSKQPHWHHQANCGKIFALLDAWNATTGLGEASLAPGVIFADDDDVEPDVVWVSAARLADSLDETGKLLGVPELAIEVLSPGALNERRDREAKLKLYSRRSVSEYRIVDGRNRTVDVYKREGSVLALGRRLSGEDMLSSPILPGFSASLSGISPRVAQR